MTRRENQVAAQAADVIGRGEKGERECAVRPGYWYCAGDAARPNQQGEPAAQEEVCLPSIYAFVEMVASFRLYFAFLLFLYCICRWSKWRASGSALDDTSFVSFYVVKVLHLQCPGAIVNFKKKDNALCRILPTLSRGRLGCTRIQLGVQHTDDEILKLNNRGHGVDKSIAAIQCARDAGFKVDGHLMPDLPGAWL
jgi:hypothetical protein